MTVFETVVSTNSQLRRFVLKIMTDIIVRMSYKYASFLSDVSLKPLSEPWSVMFLNHRYTKTVLTLNTTYSQRVRSTKGNLRLRP